MKTVNKVSNTKTEKVRKQCTSCGKQKDLKQDFYISNNPYDSDKRLNICKQCLKNNIDYNNISTVKQVLLQINRPFIYQLWLSSIEEANSKASQNSDIFGCYMKTIYLNFKDLTWADSDNDSKSASQIPTIVDIDKNKQIINIKKDEFILSDDTIDKWGEGYTPEEYRLFEKKWKKLIDNYGEKTALHTEGLITFIRFRVKEELATANGDLKGAKDWGALASSASKDAKLNVSQLSKSDISGGVDLMSQLFEAVESEVGVIPLLPRLLEQPYDDADMIIWSIVNYTRRLEDKPPVAYRDIWTFYDDMLEEHFKQKDFNDKQIKEFKERRNNVFRDLSEIYKEPLYEGED